MQRPKTIFIFLIFIYLKVFNATETAIPAHKIVDNVKVPQYSELKGILTLEQCMAACGCGGFGIAAYSNDTNACYCGEDVGETCTDICLVGYSTAGISSNFETEPASPVEINELFAYAGVALDGVTMYGAFYDDKHLAVFDSPAFDHSFATPGTHFLVIEPNAFHGCPSTLASVEVTYSVVNGKYSGPEHLYVAENATFLLKYDGPDTATQLSLSVSKDGTQVYEEIFENPSGTLFMEIGGLRASDRYAPYDPTFQDIFFTAVYINENHYLPQTATLTAFSAYITRKGQISFLLLHPACPDDTHGYCFTKDNQCASDCQTNSTTAYIPSSLLPFYPEAGRFGPTDGDAPDPLTPRETGSTTVSTMFSILRRYTFTADHLGVNVFPIPAEEQSEFTAGTVLGWSPNYNNTDIGPADVAFNTIDPTQTLGEIAVDNIFEYRDDSQFEPPYTFHDTEHMVSMTVKTKPKFQLNFIGNEADVDGGVYETVATVTDDDGTATEIARRPFYTVDPIVNVTLNTSTGDTVFLSSQVIELVVTAASGLGAARYKFKYSEDDEVTWSEVEIFNTSTIPIQFTWPGNKFVSIEVFTSIASESVLMELSIVCLLDSISFFNTYMDEKCAVNEIDPIDVADTEMLVPVYMSGCGDFVVAYTLASENAVVEANATITASNSSVVVMGTAAFASTEQMIAVGVCASNGKNEYCVNTTGYVQAPISAITTTFDPFPTNASGLFSLSATGTNYTWCVIDKTNNKTINCTAPGLYNEPVIEVTFNVSGNYSIFVEACNKLSNANDTIIVEVQDMVEGIELEVEPTMFTTPIKLSFTIKQGTGMSIAIDWGDGTVFMIHDVDANNARNITIDQENGWGISGEAHHVYATKQDYNISLTASNAVSTLTEEILAIIEDPLTNDEVPICMLNFTQAENGTEKLDYIEELEEILLTLTHYGPAERVTYLFDLNNGTSFNQSVRTYQFAYDAWFLCYNVSVNATNPVSNCYAEVEVCVERPLFPINVTDVVNAPENCTEEMSMMLKLTSGNYFTCTFNYSVGDLFEYEFTDFTTESDVDTIEVFKQFDVADYYNVSVLCINRLYEYETVFEVLSQCPVIPPFIEKQTVCKGGVEGGLLGDKKDEMDGNCTMRIRLMDQEGSAVTDVGFLKVKGKVLMNATFNVEDDNVVVADFSGIWWQSKLLENPVLKAKVEIVSSNEVSSHISIIEVSLLMAVKEVNVELKSNPSITVAALLQIDYGEIVPGNPCLELDWGDIALPPLIYGGPTCKDSFGVVEFPTTQQHKFTKPGEYVVSVKIFNSISEVIADPPLQILVVDFPCSPPGIQFQSPLELDQAGLADTRSHHFICKVVYLIATITTNCTRPNSVVTKKISVDFLTETGEWENVVEEQEFGYHMELPASSLKNLGVYRAVFVGEMVDSESAEPVIATLISTTGYFYMIPCDFQLNVENGDIHTMQRTTATETIDLTSAIDPTDDFTDFTAQFFCSRENDSLGLPMTVEAAPRLTYPQGMDITKYTPEDFAKTHGCFSQKDIKENLLSDKGHSSLRLMLKTFHFWYYWHDLRVLITRHKDPFQRELVHHMKVYFTENEPVKANFTCRENCKQLISPITKISLESKVTNMHKCNGKVSYTWQVFCLLRANEAEGWAEITDKLEASTGFGKRNLNMNADMLKHEYMYMFRLRLECDGLDTSYYGYIRNVSKRPDVSTTNCTINRKEADALEPVTVQCLGVHGKITPLHFTVFYKYANSDLDYQSLSQSSSAIPRSWTVKIPPKENHGDSENCLIRVRVRNSDNIYSDINGLSIKILKPLRFRRSSVNDVADPYEALCHDITTEYVQSSLFTRAQYVHLVISVKQFISTELYEKCTVHTQDALISLPLISPEDVFFSEANLQEDGDNFKALQVLQNIIDSLDMFDADQLKDIAAKVFSRTSTLGSGVGEEGDRNIAFALSMEDSIGSRMVVSMMSGEPPAMCETPLGVVKVEIVEPGAGRIGEFDMPDIGGKGGGAVSSVGGNRYKNAKSSGNIKSAVKGLSLTEADGTMKVVANLTEKIYLKLENDEPLPPPKNFTAYCELMRDIHRVDVAVNESVMVLTARPHNESFDGYLFLFMNKGSAPSLAEHNQNCTLPRPLPDLWQNMTAQEQALWKKEKEWSCFFSERDFNLTAIGVWCVGVLFYTDEEPLATKLLPRSANVSDSNCTETVGYSFFAYTRACLYWDKPASTWTNDGCECVEEETNTGQTMCACTHLTDFGGGGPFADAEPLDLAGALGNANLEDNPTIFSVVMGLFGLYLILLLWSRKNDKIDSQKNQLIYLPENHSNDKYLYEICVSTGFKPGCSTTADVVIVITGENGESGPRRLYSKTRKCFQRADIDFFVLALPASLGEIQHIDIWHNNAGASPGWHLLNAQVRDMQTEQQVQFICNQWFDVAEDDGMIIRQLTPSSYEQQMDFKYLFFTTARRNFYDGHIWASIFTRPAQSGYTRCQRLATCMTLLMTMMLGNCMFYRGDTGIPSKSIRMGPFTFSVDEIKTSLTVGLMVIPFNLLLIMLFKKAGPKPDPNKEKYEEVEAAEEPKPRAITDEEKVREYRQKYNGYVRFFRSICFAGAEDDEYERKQKKKKPLPHWLQHIAYLLAFLITIICAFFVIMYGFQFGKIKSDKWVVSMLFSFCYSVFLFQPLKVMILSVLFAILLKAPPNVSSKNLKGFATEEELEEQEEEEVIKGLEPDANKFKLPEERKLNEFRQSRLKEKRIKIILKEVIVHLSFVVLVIIVAYSAADPSSFRFHDSVHQLCASNGITNDYYGGIAYVKGDNKREVLSGYDVRTRLQWFDWARYSVIEYLFPDGWYDDSEYPPGFVADSATSKVLAMARFRQLRVKRNSCTKHPVFEYLVVECNAGYSWTSEESQEFRSGWREPYNYTERVRRRRGKRKAMWKGLEDPWMHQNTSILKNPFPFTGKFNTYGGSSYSVSIGPNKQVAKRIVKELKKDFWVDRYTRALFTEINIYNANTNLMLIVTFVHEILPTGGWNFYTNVQALRLYRYVGGLGDLIMLFDIIFTTITLIGVYKSVRAIRRTGAKEYLSNFWNMLHVVVTGNSLCAIIFTLGRMLAVQEAIEQYTEEPELFVSFQFVGALEYLIIGALGFVLFFTNLEFLRILRFNHLIALLTRTIIVMSSPLMSFGLIFFVIFMAYVSFAHCIYVDKLEEFQSVMSSFVSLTKMFLGKFDVHAYFDNAPFFGPLMFASYMLSIQMIMINLFVGLICDAFAECGEEDGPDDEPSVLGFVANRVKSLNSGVVGPEPIYSDWKDEWEEMMEGFETRCDTCVYMMRNMEGEETRQKRFFEENNEKKRNMMLAVVGIDFLNSESELCDGLATLESRLADMSEEETEMFLKQAAGRRMQNQQQAILDRVNETREEEEEEEGEEEEEDDENYLTTNFLPKYFLFTKNCYDHDN